ncbi:MAG: hypothetical protein LBB63_00860 [Holosporaceae bacterium]|nr:hypothetical protein [Holosporaceae bacterium]
MRIVRKFFILAASCLMISGAEGMDGDWHRVPVTACNVFSLLKTGAAEVIRYNLQAAAHGAQGVQGAQADLYAPLLQVAQAAQAVQDAQETQGAGAQEAQGAGAQGAGAQGAQALALEVLNFVRDHHRYAYKTMMLVNALARLATSAANVVVSSTNLSSDWKTCCSVGALIAEVLLNSASFGLWCYGIRGYEESVMNVVRSSKFKLWMLS